MARKAGTKNFNKSNEAGIPPDNLHFDEFTIPSLIEAQIANIPLNQEEKRQLSYILENPTLRDQYYGLMMVMQNMQRQQSAPTVPRLLYLLQDSKGQIYQVEQAQTSRYAYLTEGGARLIAIEPVVRGQAPAPRYNLPEMGLLLDFSQERRVGIRATEEADLARVAETTGNYNFQSVEPPWLKGENWALQVDTGQGQSYRLSFDEKGEVSLPVSASEVTHWQLVREDGR